MEHWFAAMQAVSGRPYAEQIAYLREDCGFSQAHANALVMYSRGSTTSRRVGTVDEYLAGADPTAAGTVRAILRAVLAAYPDLAVVIAWNQPMVMAGGHYVFGVSVSAKHILIAPWGRGVLDQFCPRLTGYTVNTKTIRIPVDWDVDPQLLKDMVGAAIDRVARG